MSKDRLFQIPSTWCWVPLGEIAEVKLGKMLSRKAFESGLIQLPYLRNQNVRWGRIDYSDIKIMGFKKSELERYRLEPGDLLVCEGGEPGRCAIYTREPGEFMYQKALHRIRPYGGLVLSKFLQFCLWNYVTNGLVLPRPSETTIQHLPREEMLGIPIPLAPLSEQERIVAEIEKQLTRIDVAQDSLNRAKHNLRRFRTSVLTELSREGGPVQNKAIQLSKILTVDLANGRSVPTKKGGFPVLRLTSIDRGRINPEEQKEGAWSRRDAEPFIVKEGDFLVARGNGSKHLVGRGGLVESLVDEVAFPDTMIRVRVDPHLYDPRFLRLVWDSPFIRSQIEKAARTTAGIYKINQNDVRNVLLPQTSLETQIELVGKAEALLSAEAALHTAVEANLLRSSNLRASILKKAFEGTLAPQDPNEEPALSLLDRLNIEYQRPQRGRGIKPGVLTPGSEPQHPPKPRRGAGNTVRESASAPSGLPDESGDASLGLKPQALRPGPFRATPTGGNSVTRERSSPTGKTEEGQDFLGLSREEQIDHVWESLLGLGAVEKDEAIRTVANDLREKGLAQFQRLRQGGALYEAISSAIDRGVRAGSFDRPRRGTVRALLPDAREYSPEEWRRCLLVSLNNHAIDEEDALRSAAEWARENMGLEFSRLREDGVILRGLREALNDAIRRGEIQRKHGQIRVP